MVIAPVQPLLCDYLNADGSTDHELLDHADDQYRRAYSVWWEDHGKKEAEIDVCWILRSIQIERGLTR